MRHGIQFLVALALTTALGCGGSPSSRKTAAPRVVAAETAPPAPTPPAAVEPPPLVEPPPTEPPPVEPPPVEPPPVEPPPLAGPMFRGLPLGQLLIDLKTKPVVRVKKRFDRAETLYWLELEGGLEIAFKPEVAHRKGLYKNDITAFVAALLLGIHERTPPAIDRLVPLASLVVPGKGKPTAVLHPAREDKTQIWGSAIYWMPVLERSHLAGEAGERRWDGWVGIKGKLPPEYAALAEQVSTLVVFDYLQSNQDRFDHPSNLQVDEHGILVYRDNNEAWNSGAMHAMGVNRERLELVQRFSKKFIEKVRTVDAASLQAALQPWVDAGRPLLEPKRFEFYEKRRKYVVAYVDKLIKQYGEAAVLYWP